MAIMSRPRPGSVLRTLGQGTATEDDEFVLRLYREHAGMLFAYADRLIDDRALTEDVVQQTLVAAWRDRGSVRADPLVRRRLLSIARDIIVSRWRAPPARSAGAAPAIGATPRFADRAEAIVGAVVALESAVSQPRHGPPPPDGEVALQGALQQIRAEAAATRHRPGLNAPAVAVAVILALAVGVLAGRQMTGASSAPPHSHEIVAGAGTAPANAAAATADVSAIQDLVKNRRARLGSIPDGSFVNTCTLSHRNSDNFIVSPGVVHGANHIHDYYGNGTTNAFATVESLRADSSSECRDPTDISAYWLPALLRDGQPVEPDLALFVWRGYDRDIGEVVPMPQGLKMITGSAKASTAQQSNAQFTCTGSAAAPRKTIRSCAGRSRLVRIQDFPSCWDGVHLDSPNHRTHVVFQRNGGCPASNPVPIPRLRFLFVYPITGAAGVTLSSVPEIGGLSFSDHADVVNLYPTRRMFDAVQDCINAGITC
jgi:DNA-directed RNA polymerase specialized sigma24 family protein